MKTQTNKRIFIVDDDLVYLEIMKNEISELTDIEIETFTSAEDCLMQMHLHPDLIVLDFNLDSTNPKNMTGYEAAKAFFLENPKLKILFISGERNEFLLNEYKKYRSIDFILKTDYGCNQIQQKIVSHLNAA